MVVTVTVAAVTGVVAAVRPVSMIWSWAVWWRMFDDLSSCWCLMLWYILNIGMVVDYMVIDYIGINFSVVACSWTRFGSGLEGRGGGGQGGDAGAEERGRARSSDSFLLRG